MRVHNLSDVETPKLTQYSLCDVTFAVGSELLAPGASVEVPDSAALRARLAHFLEVGAACIGDPPESYAEGKTKKSSEPKPGLVRLDGDYEGKEADLGPTTEETKAEAPSSKNRW